MSPRARAAPAFAAVLALATALRLLGFDLVYDGDAIRLRPDGDAVYHGLRARHLAATHEVLWVDPALNPPHGARVLWPPLLEAAIVGTAWVATGGEPSPRDVDAAAALLPVALGVLAVVVAGALGAALLGHGHALLSAFGLAVAPAAAFYSIVGRSDQHVLELLLFELSLLLVALAARATTSRARRVRALLLGAVLALSFWSWQGSALALLVLAAAAALDHVLAPPGAPPDRRLSLPLAEGALAGSVLLAASIAAFGPEGALASGRVEGVSGLGVAACAATGLGAGLLAVAARRASPPLGRVAEVAAAALVGVGAILAVPAVRTGVARGLAPVSRSNPWYDVIGEFQPMFVGDLVTAGEDLEVLFFVYGLFPVLAAAGAAALPALARRDPERRAGLALLATAAAVLVPLWIWRRRFDLYAIVPIVLLAAAAARSLAERVLATRAPRWLAAGAAALVVAAAAPCARAFGELSLEQDAGFAPVTRVAERLGAAIARGDGAPGVVLASWGRGHHIRVGSGLPALVTPFGSDAGADAMTDWARFLLARTPEEADAVLDARGVRWLLLEPLELDLVLAQRLVPGGPAPVEQRGPREGIALLPPARALVSARLYWSDGNATESAPALDGYRLVDEDFAPAEPARLVKLFERVKGACLRVTGAPPGARVEADVALVLPTGRRTSLVVEALADGTGRTELRLPYALGANGRVDAGPWEISAAGTSRQIAVPQGAVRDGTVASVALR